MHTHRNSVDVKNRHVCKAHAETSIYPTAFKASSPPKPKAFRLSDLPVYSTRLNKRDVNRFEDLVPILEMEGRKVVTQTRTRGFQAGEWDDDKELKNALKLDFEYKMVIEDWFKTPIYSIMIKNMSERDGLIKCLNKATINRLAQDYVERREFMDRVKLR